MVASFPHGSSSSCAQALAARAASWRWTGSNMRRHDAIAGCAEAGQGSTRSGGEERCGFPARRGCARARNDESEFTRVGMSRLKDFSAAYSVRYSSTRTSYTLRPTAHQNGAASRKRMSRSPASSINALIWARVMRRSTRVPKRSSASLRIA